MTELEAFHFLRPWWLLGVPTVVLSMLYLHRARDSLGKWAPIIAPHLAAAMLVRGGRGHWLNPINASAVLLLLCLLAVAGPSWERKPSPFVKDKAVLVVALDLSPSMSQTDIQPSRLERAKQKIDDLLRLRPGAPTALIVYAGSAHSVIPLTVDPDILRNFLAAVDPDMMPRPGKAAERVLPIADHMMAASGTAGTLLLITDGLGPATASPFDDYFATHPHQLVLLGVGRTANDEQLGTESIPLQRGALVDLADSSGGDYLDTSLDTRDVERINRLINHHLLTVDDASRPWVDAGYYLVFPVALLFLLWFRRGWTLHWLLACVLSLGMVASPRSYAADTRFIDLWLSPDQQGRYHFERGNYARAAQLFENTAWRGVAFYLDENFTAAADTFAQIETVEGLFNLANAWAQGENYVYAVRTYDRVLAMAPDHAGALKNRALVQSIIDDINRMSESQQPEAGEQSKELGDQPLRADGADETRWEKREIEQYSAEDILDNDRIRDMWLRQIQRDPAVFLGIKFQMQLEQGDDHVPD